MRRRTLRRDAAGGPGTTPTEPRGAQEARWRRRVRACGVVAVVLAVVAAVGVVAERRRAGAAWEAARQPVVEPARRAGDIEVPTIRWSNGRPDHGRWADDPWVQAVREFAVLWPVAELRADLAGSAQLREYVSADYLDVLQGELEAVLASEDREGKGFDVYYPGPRPFEVIDVMETRDGATVRTCAPRVVGGFADATLSLEERMAATRGLVIDWLLEQDAEGRRVLTGSQGGRYLGSSACEISDVRVALFEPMPVPAVDPRWGEESERLDMSGSSIHRGVSPAVDR